MSKEIEINGLAVYHTYPDDGNKHPGIVLIEDIWGVGDHMKNVADRFAKEGYGVAVPEILPKGLLETLTPQFRQDLADPEKRNEAQPKMRAAMQPVMQPEYAKDAVAKLKSCVDYLLADEHVNGNVGVVGFCFGGTYTFHLASHDDRVRVAVPFYGQAPSAEEIPNIQCPILGFYGDQDANLMETLPELKENMKKDGKDFEAVVYENAGHAFFNDTNPHAYKPEAAEDAWKRTLVILKDKLA